MAGLGEEARLSVSVYLLKKSKTVEAQQQLEAASAAVYPLIDKIPGGAFIALPADADAPRWLEPIARRCTPA